MACDGPDADARYVFELHAVGSSLGCPSSAMGEVLPEGAQDRLCEWVDACGETTLRCWDVQGPSGAVALEAAVDVGWLDGIGGADVEWLDAGGEVVCSGEYDVEIRPVRQ